MGQMLSFFLNGAFAMQLCAYPSTLNIEALIRTRRVDHYYMNYASTDRRFFVYLGQLGMVSLELCDVPKLTDSDAYLLTVCFVVALELTHMCLSTHTAYVMLADGFANPAILLTSPVSGAALPAVNGAGTYY